MGVHGFERLCANYQIPLTNGARVAKRLLVEKLLQERQPVFAPHLVPQLSSKTESELDGLLDTLMTKEELTLADKPQSRHPLTITQLCHELDAIKDANEKYKWSWETAAKPLHAKPQWKGYKSPKVLANTRRQANSHIAKLESNRSQKASYLLLRLLVRYSQDEVAMSLWTSFCRWFPPLVRAHYTGNMHMALEAGAQVDKILQSDHPFAVSLCLLWVPVSTIWNAAGKFTSRLDQDPAGTLTGLGFAGMGQEEALGRLDFALRDAKVFEPMQKPRKKKASKSNRIR